MASFGTITTPAPTQAPIATAVNYFVTINQLTAHNTVSAHEETVQQTPQSPLLHLLEPFFPYAPFVLVALLFVVAFGIQVVYRARSLKNISTALVLAVLVASMPMMLTYVSQGSRQTVSAGPDEIPREVRVQANTPSSVIISWRTDAKHVGVVRLGAVPFAAQTPRVYLANNREEVQMHSVSINGLKKGTTYEFEILSGTSWYDNGGKYIQFTAR